MRPAVDQRPEYIKYLNGRGSWNLKRRYFLVTTKGRVDFNRSVSAHRTAHYIHTAPRTTYDTWRAFSEFRSFRAFWCRWYDAALLVEPL